MNNLLSCVLEGRASTALTLDLLLYYIAHLTPNDPWAVTVPASDLRRLCGDRDPAEIDGYALRLPVADPAAECHKVAAITSYTLRGKGAARVLVMECGDAAAPLLCMLHLRCSYIRDSLDAIVALPDMASKYLYLAIADMLPDGPCVVRAGVLRRIMHCGRQRAQAYAATLQAALEAVQDAMGNAYTWAYVTSARGNVTGVRIIPAGGRNNNA